MHVCLHVCVCVCVSPSPMLLITNSVIWTLHDQLNKVLHIYVAAVVGTISRHDLSSNVHHGN